MTPPIRWGPTFWTFFHTISLCYPANPSDIDKEMAIGLINSIKYILPCQACRDHFSKNISSNPLDSNDLASKENFIEWFIDIHNVVNKMLKKHQLSYEEAMRRLNSLDINNYKNLFAQVINMINVNNNDKKQRKHVLQFITSCLHFGNMPIPSNMDYTTLSNFKIMIKPLLH